MLKRKGLVKQRAILNDLRRKIFYLNKEVKTWK